MDTLSLRRHMEATTPSVVLGAVVALASWWALDLLSTEIDRSLNLATPSVGLPVTLFVMVAIATAILLISAKAMLAAGMLLLVGIVLGLLANSGVRVVGLEGPPLLVVMRGAYNPGMLAVAAAWSGVALLGISGGGGATRWVRRTDQSRAGPETEP